MTEPKSAAELEAIVRQAVVDHPDAQMLTIRVEPMHGERPNWECVVKYKSPDHGWGPDPSFIDKVTDVQKQFHLQE
jgi:hypothetical protein